MTTRATKRTKISVDVGSAGKAISPDLFGAFFEDLNHAADGGLYAELVQNRSFEYSAHDAADWHSLTAWEPVALGGGHGTLRTDTADPVHPANPHYAVVDVAAAGTGVGLLNTGFDGIPVEAGTSYLLSLYARRTAGEDTPLAVRLAGADGSVYGEASIGGPASTWARHETVITPRVTDPDARLLVLATGPGTVHLDLVSLFPEATFRGRRNGLRADLAQAVADLEPKFLRFPGGCLVHGSGLGNTYRWKDTIGPLEQRRQQRNLWGYHQSMGLGYFEYFQFCEDIGAKPLPVVAAGVCCQNTPGGPQGIPLDEMPSYVQEVLDLIEYANGSADSAWGARRAAAGHPEPFGLEYLGVGNEDAQTPAFRERFEMVNTAVREAHPEITVIGTAGPNPAGADFRAGWESAHELGLAMVDEHAYLTPRWFLQNTRRYDSYDRGGPKVYLGEWASKGETLHNALAEAAYMNALERNGDIVALASYAPLLAKSGHTQWTPDLIHFDNTSVRLTVNYHVQRMHSTHQGDVYLPHVVTDPPTAAPPADVLCGGVFLGTTDTGAEFAGLRVSSDGRTLLGEDHVELDGTARHFMDLMGAATPDYTIEVRARKTAGEEGFLIGFGAVDKRGDGDHYTWNLGGWHNLSLTLQRTCDGFTEDLDTLPGQIECGRWYDSRIEVESGIIRCFLDGVMIHEIEDDRSEPASFSVSAVRDSATGDIFIKMVNLTPTEVTADVRLDGAGNAAVRAARTVLSGELTDRAATSRTSVIVAGDAFDCALPARSFTVLCLQGSDSVTGD